MRCRRLCLVSHVCSSIHLCVGATGACWHRHSILSICCSYSLSSSPEKKWKNSMQIILDTVHSEWGVPVLVCRLPLSAARVSRRPALLLLLLEFYILARKCNCRRNDDARDHGRRLVNVSDQIDTYSRATAGTAYSAHFLYISPPKTLTIPSTTLYNCRCLCRRSSACDTSKDRGYSLSIIIAQVAVIV